MQLSLALVTNYSNEGGGGGGVKCTGLSLSQKLVVSFAKQRNQLHNYFFVLLVSIDFVKLTIMHVCVCRQLVCFVCFVLLIRNILPLRALFCFIQVFPLGMNRKSIDFKKNKNFL